MTQLSKMIAEAMVRDILDQKKEAEAPKRPIAVQARVMKDMLPIVTRPCPFQVGDLITQIKTFEKYQLPDVVLVTEVGPQPRGRADNAVERLDIKILTTCSGGEHWTEYAVESWRFDKYTGEIA